MRMNDVSPKPTTIRNLRLKLGVTQEEAAALVMASARTWRAWEAGFRNMPAAKWHLMKLRASAK